MVEAGLTPMQAITNATSNAAALLKLDDRGVLASGKRADLVVLEGDPTADISNSRKIHAVWHRGKKAAGPVETFTPLNLLVTVSNRQDARGFPADPAGARQGASRCLLMIPSSFMAQARANIAPPSSSKCSL
jgi:hypothetical protein